MKLQQYIIRLLVVGLLFFVACKKSDDEGGDLLLGKEHATWSRSIFFKGYDATSGEPLTQSNLEEFAKTLMGNKVKYAYMFSGPYGDDGKLPEWAFSSQAIQSVQEIKKHYPGVKILPWLGGIEGRTVHIDSVDWRENALASTKKLVETLDVDGVHIDFEKFQSPLAYTEQGLPLASKIAGERYGKGVIQFHKDLRVRMPKLFVSSVVVSTAKDTKPWKRKHTLAELKELFPLVDQISFLFYDTGIKDNSVFQGNMIEQLEMIKEIQNSIDYHPQVLMAIGTFVNEEYLRKHRDLNIENNTNTLRVLKHALRTVPSERPLIDGLAIYCEWQTDADEWKEIQENWSNL